MGKTKFLAIAVVALFVLNFIVIGFFYFGNHRSMERNRSMPRAIIVKRLHFDKEQQRRYDVLISVHRSKIDSLEQKIREAKNDLYLLLDNPNADDKIKDSLISQLGMYQVAIENIHFQHFQDIKKLCRKDQLENYKELTAELSRIFSHPPPNR